MKLKTIKSIATLIMIAIFFGGCCTLVNACGSDSRSCGSGSKSCGVEANECGTTDSMCKSYSCGNSECPVRGDNK